MPDPPRLGLCLNIKLVRLSLFDDDTDAAFELLVAEGAGVLSGPHDWLDDLRIAWVTDPDNNPIQLVQKRG